MCEAYNPYLKFSMEHTNTTLYRQAWSSHRVWNESDRSDAYIGTDNSRCIWKFYAVRFRKTIKPVNTLHTHFIRHSTWYGLPVSDTDFGGFLSDTAVLRFYTDFN